METVTDTVWLLSKETARFDSNLQASINANIRTHLSWLRTSLSLVGFGSAVAQFMTKPAAIIGALFIGLAAVYVLAATHRYQRMYSSLVLHHCIETGNRMVILTSLVTICVFIAVVLVNACEI